MVSSHQAEDSLENEKDNEAEDPICSLSCSSRYCSVSRLCPKNLSKRRNHFAFFREYVGLNDDQIATIRSGKALARVLESRTPDEVFVFGAVYVGSTPEKYVKLASNIDSLRKLPNYLAIQEFSDPPQLSDLDGFTLEEQDVQELKKCKPGHCEVQLPQRGHRGFPTIRGLVVSGRGRPSEPLGKEDDSRSDYAIPARR